MIQYGYMAILRNCMSWLQLPAVDYDESGHELSASSFSDVELSCFVRAAVQVQRIGDTYAAKFPVAESAEELSGMKESAAAEMVEAVENEGISVEKYREIALLAQSDDGIANRLKEQIMKIGG